MDGNDRLSFDMSPGVPILFRVKNMLFERFGLEDEIEGVYTQEDELHEDAYRRKISEVLAGRMNPSFDYNFWLNGYVKRAEDMYGREDD